jgi:NOL1/NOP2/fmu family ribosome biogenesis protein
MDMIELQFGCRPKLDYVFLKSSKDKVYLVNKQVFDIEHKRLKINSVGLYFAELYSEGIRLSIEGTQLIGPYAKKGVVEISQKQEHDWLKGSDLDVEGYEKAFVSKLSDSEAEAAETEVWLDYSLE